MTDQPRVAIVHYHLRRGGVSRVIETACGALARLGIPTVVLTGQEPEVPFPPNAGPVCVIPELQYDDHAPCHAGAVRALRKTLETQAVSALKGRPDVWHFHNSALGKNPAVTCLVDCMAGDGVALLQQVHDFAEDQRPANWLRLLASVGAGTAAGLDQRLYPVAEHARIAVLNERDRRIMLQAGAPSETVLLLPNPVVPPAGLDPDPATDAEDGSRAEARRWVYPTRAIRRKNLGEFILWSAMADQEDSFATTLEPTNPRDRQVYEEWVRLTAALRLPVTFGVGLQGEAVFRQTMRNATALVTTSVAEGFGLAFLEPWLLGKPLAGRRLPEITADMETDGIDLSMLYDRLDVPLKWIGKDHLRARLEKGLARLYRSYAVSPPADGANRALEAVVQDQKVDFGGLDENLQQNVVRKVALSAAAAAMILPSTSQTIAPETLRRNRRLVSEQYSPAAYGRRLQKLYTSLLQKRGNLMHVSATGVLNQFLQPERFRLLRS